MQNSSYNDGRNWQSDNSGSAYGAGSGAAPWNSMAASGGQSGLYSISDIS